MQPALSDVETELQGEVSAELALVVPGQSTVRPLTVPPPPSLHQQDLQLPGSGLQLTASPHLTVISPAESRDVSSTEVSLALPEGHQLAGGQPGVACNTGQRTEDIVQRT